MHTVGVDAQGRGGRTGSGWMHRFGVDTNSPGDANGRGGMHKLGVHRVGVDAQFRGRCIRSGGCTGSG